MVAVADAADWFAIKQLIGAKFSSFTAVIVFATFSLKLRADNAAVIGVPALPPPPSLQIPSIKTAGGAEVRGVTEAKGVSARLVATCDFFNRPLDWDRLFLVFGVSTTSLLVKFSPSINKNRNRLKIATVNKTINPSFTGGVKLTRS